jgi:hypothetical protein
VEATQASGCLGSVRASHPKPLSFLFHPLRGPSPKIIGLLGGPYILPAWVRAKCDKMRVLTFCSGASAVHQVDCGATAFQHLDANASRDRDRPSWWPAGMRMASRVATARPGRTTRLTKWLKRSLTAGCASPASSEACLSTPSGPAAQSAPRALEPGGRQPKPAKAKAAKERQRQGFKLRAFPPPSPEPLPVPQ